MFSASAISNFWISLEVMGLGMFGIFTVILAIMGVVVVLTKAGSKTGKSEDE
ncbi:hypothetical protein [Anaerotruncus rubiinfantis]|uniref:hypothetical protein n=1 Tax=Anaerotruncus rubiinfantis TaxID=1720200 RepID=UPI000AE7EDDD|nr:hypothetical protein [Anaerotruncus rubiinfantis]